MTIGARIGFLCRTIKRYCAWCLRNSSLMDLLELGNVVTSTGAGDFGSFIRRIHVTRGVISPSKKTSKRVFREDLLEVSVPHPLSRDFKSCYHWLSRPKTNISKGA